MHDYFICPNCGAQVPDNALACPECGSDEETGWSEDTAYDGLYLYDDEPLSGSTSSHSWTKVATAVLLIVIAFAVLSAVLGQWGFYLALILAGGAGIFYYITQIRPSSPSQREEALYQDLRRKARGDTSLVERLIAYEQRRNPRASRQQWLQDAIARWERDNR
ncbi:MAG: zinc ribbon domain-containing protein [Chloroflexota bacterium]